MKNIVTITAIYLLFCIKQVVCAAPVYDISNTKSFNNISNYLVWTSLEIGQQNIDDVVKLPSHEWKNETSVNHDLALIKGEQWFSFDLENRKGNLASIFLIIQNRLHITELALYIKMKNNTLLPVDININSSHQYISDIAISPFNKVTAYLFVKASAASPLPVNLFSQSEFIENNSIGQLSQGMAIGGALCLIFASFLLFLASGRKSIFLIFSYLLATSTLLLVLLGLNLVYFFPQYPELLEIDRLLLTTISSILLILMSSTLFKLKQSHHQINRAITLSCWVIGVVLLLSLLLDAKLYRTAANLIHGAVICSMFILGLYLSLKRYRLAVLFSVAMFVQFTSIIINAFSVEWFVIDAFAPYKSMGMLYNFSFFLNSVFIIFIFGRHYILESRAQFAAQGKALDDAMLSRKEHEELLTIQNEHQEQLEIRVQERTLELNIALQELENVNRELEEKNTLDELSGLYNRRYYDQKILAEYRRSKRNLTPLSLVLIDIDHFKNINDTYGHLAGDQCIVWIAERIKQSLKRSTDMSFRYGGEEFCLILPDTDSAGAIALAEGLKESININPCQYQQIELKLTASFGVTTYQQQKGILPEQIFAASDKALYLAKHNGRNQVQQQALTEP